MPTSDASGMPRSPLFSTTWGGLTSFMAPSSRKANTNRVLITRPAQAALVTTGAGGAMVDMSISLAVPRRPRPTRDADIDNRSFRRRAEQIGDVPPGHAVDLRDLLGEDGE